MKAPISEKQWAAIIALGWVVLFVHASSAHSLPVVPLSEGRALEHIRQVRAADTAGPLLITVSRTVCHQPHEGVQGHIWPMAFSGPF